MSPSPLGETLRRARTTRNISLEDAERVTRIPRKYLEALELENFGILPAPVYARGFLRSYASYLGLEPNDLLPFFPVGHVEEPRLDPLPEVDEPRTWNMNGIVAIAVVGLLILLVIGLYAVGRDDGSATLRGDSGGNTAPLTNNGVDSEGEGGAGGGIVSALPDLVGLTEQEAMSIIQETGATPLVVATQEGDIPAGQVISQSPEEGAEVGAGDLVTITVAE
jgi:hypothetical protein